VEFAVTLADFKLQETSYVASVANVAGVQFNRVAIGNIVDGTRAQRRLLTPRLSIEFKVTLTSLAEASRIAGTLNINALNAAFLLSGLPSATLSVPPTVASAVSKAAQQRAITRERLLEQTLLDQKLTSPVSQPIYIDITIDGEKHPKNNDAVVLLYLLCIFLIILAILLLLWARHYFWVKSNATESASYDAMQTDVKMGPAYNAPFAGAPFVPLAAGSYNPYSRTHMYPHMR